MPHLPPGNRRTRLLYAVENLRGTLGLDAPIAPKAELNFVIARLLAQYCKDNGFNYQNSSDAKAAATDCAAEFQRLYIDPYEDLKIEENGNAFELEVP